jgi:Flp pilus assembly protein TadD
VLFALFALVLAGPDAKTVFQAAEQALRSGDLTGAERGFREFLKIKPDHAGALGNLGVVYSRMGRYQDAISTYEQARKLAPDSPDLNLNLGLAWLKQDDHRAARAALERAAVIRPNHAQTRELLATTQMFTGDVDRAVATLESLPLSTGVQYLLSIGYLKQSKRQKALESITRLFETLAPSQAHLLAGRAYYESSLFEKAQAELIKARDLDPSLPGVWRELGKTHVSLRRSEEARASLRKAVELQPDDMEAVYFLGALLVQEGAAKDGVPLLERARAARPASWGPWYYLGKAALSSGEPARAVELLMRAAELHPYESPVFYQLARALKSAGRDEESRVTLKKYSELRAKEQTRAAEALVLR